MQREQDQQADRCSARRSPSRRARTRRARGSRTATTRDQREHGVDGTQRRRRAGPPDRARAGLERRVPAALARPRSPARRDRRLRRLTDETAPRLGMSAAASSCARAVGPRPRSSCSPRVTARAKRSSGAEPGGTFTVPRTGDHRSRRMRREVLGGDEFVFDVQTHLLEFDTSTADAAGGDFGARSRTRSAARPTGASASASTTGSARCSCGPTRRWPSSRPSRSSVADNPLSIEVMEQARQAAPRTCAATTTGCCCTGR